MTSPIFLDLAYTLRLHQSLIDTYGGANGVRDMGLLLSAIAMPQATFGGSFLHADRYEMAAAYLYHIVKNHPFIDGNKRTGAAAAIVFLEMNDVELTNDEVGLVEITLAAANGEIDKSRIAEFFRSIVREPRK